MGAAVYRPDLDYPDVIGEVPSFTPQVFAALGTQGRITADETRYEVLIEQATPAGSQLLVLRLNSEEVAQRVSAFFWRVMGLVLVIASFVGTAIVGSVWKWIVQPVITLRDALTSARRDPLGAEKWQVHVGRMDEIGELLHETNDLLVAISGNYRDDVGALSMLVQSASDSVIVYDKAGLVTFANEAAKALALDETAVAGRDAGPHFKRAGDSTRRSVSDLIAGTSFHDLVTLLDGSKEVPCQLLAVRVRFGVVALLRI
jgi:PAS domain-containing protein